VPDGTYIPVQHMAGGIVVLREFCAARLGGHSGRIKVPGAQRILDAEFCQDLFAQFL
jgi:hypothetical protein